MAFELERLQGSIDRLTQTVVDLKDNAVRQTAATQALGEKQNADFRALLLLLQDNFTKLVDRQDAMFKSLVDRQDASFKNLLDRQDAAFRTFGDRLDRLVERQDSHFRWLAGLIVASALGVGLTFVRLAH